MRRPCSSTFAGDVVANGRIVNLQVESGDELLMNGREAWIDVVYVNRRCIGRLCFPKASNGSREQPKHAAHPLEIC